MCFRRTRRIMPEMPEVETIARQLRKSIVGKRVAEVRLSGLALRKSIPETFIPRLLGRTVRNVHRRGKYLMVELEPQAFLMIHLGMSGRILFFSSMQQDPKHRHAVFRFTDATVLEYRDPRRFGMLGMYEVASMDQVPELHRLGMEPLTAGFTGKWLSSRLSKSRQQIKAFLLDQRMIAGLGNIYACEALFQAGIHPARRCATLTGAESERLVAAIRSVLRAAIRNQGTSFSDFMGADGNRGRNQQFLKVFQREGDSCIRCGSPIQRIRQGGRSSFCCARCQN